MEGLRFRRSGKPPRRGQRDEGAGAQAAKARGEERAVPADVPWNAHPPFDVLARARILRGSRDAAILPAAAAHPAGAPAEELRDPVSRLAGRCREGGPQPWAVVKSVCRRAREGRPYGASPDRARHVGMVDGAGNPVDPGPVVRDSVRRVVARVATHAGPRRSFSTAPVGLRALAIEVRNRDDPDFRVGASA